MKTTSLAIFFKPFVIVLAGVSAFVVSSSFMSGAAESRQIVDRVVAVVNDDVILLSDLDEAIKPYLFKL